MAEEMRPEQDEDAADELTSQTLAELYVKQGHTDKAIKVYQKLLLNDPNNTDIVHRLKELNPADALLASAMNEEEPRPSAPRPPRSKEEPFVAATLAAANSRSADDSTEERRRKISTLENWLSTIRRERN
jgi:tetratricopeptide (TPR) repeat protein